MKYGNLMTAMITPFDENLEVDDCQVHRLAEHLVRTGSEGIVIAGTTGESPSLTAEEKERIFSAVKEAVGTQADIVMGAGTNNTAATIESVKQAARLGADGIMLVVPYYNKPSQEGLYEHFKLAAMSSDLPVILYNIPGRCGCNLLPETVVRLAEIPQITAIKEASGNLSQVTEIRMHTPQDFLIYSGDDALTLPMLSIGGNGVISVAGHVAGTAISEMIHAWKQGDPETSANLHTRLYPLFKALFLAPNPAPVKYALGRYGFDTNRLRLPLVKISDNDELILDQVLEQLDKTE